MCLWQSFGWFQAMMIASPAVCGQGSHEFHTAQSSGTDRALCKPKPGGDIIMELTTAMPVETTPTNLRVRVLAIDDDEDFCRIVKELLEPHGYDLLPVANPVKALELYTRQKDRFDLVMLD